MSGSPINRGVGYTARARARKPAGVARVRQPLRDAQARLWRARYVDLDGIVRQHGRYKPGSQ